MSESQKKLDLSAVRARLDGARGREYWRSLDDLASTPEFQDLLVREFPQQAVGWSDDEEPVEGRRNWEGTLAGVAGDAVMVETEPGKTREFPLNQIQKANLKFEW